MRCNVTVLERQSFNACSCRSHSTSCCLLLRPFCGGQKCCLCLGCSACLASQMHIAGENSKVCKRELFACLWLWTALCRGDTLSRKQMAAGCSFGGLLAYTGHHTTLLAMLARR